MKNQKICKFKYENLIFILLTIMYIIATFHRNIEFSNNMLTLLIQVLAAAGIRSMLRYVRKNPAKIKQEIKEMLSE